MPQRGCSVFTVRTDPARSALVQGSLLAPASPQVLAPTGRLSLLYSSSLPLCWVRIACPNRAHPSIPCPLPCVLLWLQPRHCFLSQQHSFKNTPSLRHIIHSHSSTIPKSNSPCRRGLVCASKDKHIEAFSLLLNRCIHRVHHSVHTILYLSLNNISWKSFYISTKRS